MTRIAIIFLIGFILVLACSTKTNKAQVKLETNPTIQQIDSQSIDKKVILDTIMELKKIGYDILSGVEISKINEKYIYDLIHCVMVKDSIDREFYFKVFNKIRNQAGGYISEDIGFYSKDFCRTYPNDFFSLEDSQLKSYAYDIGELIRTEEEDPASSAKDYILGIKKICNPKYLSKIDTFSKDIVDVIESNK
jgi:hypothetical protein